MKTIKDILELLESRDSNQECTLLSTEYEDDSSLLKFHCNICGKEFERNLRALRRNKNFCCIECGRRKNSFSIEDVRQFLKDNDINNECILLSKEYHNTNEYLLFRCNICGCEFKRTFRNTKKGRFRCEHCGEKE